MKLKLTAMATAIAALIATPVHAADQKGQQAQQNQQNQPQQAQQDARQQQPAATIILVDWDLQALYKDAWSAEQLLDTDVRGPGGEDIGEVEDIIVGPEGKIQRVVVEVGGFLDIGDRHIGVPWNEVKVGPNMEYVQVPVTEENRRGYPLYDDRAAVAGNWRVEELIGDVASLTDVPNYGRVSDVIFNASGEVKAVVVDRGVGRFGAAGRYAYPYTGYRSSYAYPLPYPGSAVTAQPRFDYVKLGELSRFARNFEPGERGVMGMEQQAPRTKPQK